MGIEISCLLYNFFLERLMPIQCPVTNYQYLINSVSRRIICAIEHECYETWDEGVIKLLTLHITA